MSKPNILIFMTDQQQEQVTHHDHPCRTPQLDRFAEESLRFTNCFTTMTHCCPSRASFMTGLYPSRHGVYNNVCNEAAIHKGLHEGVETFAEKLKQSGYSMYFSGKWHVSVLENPADRGWHELLVTAHKDAYMSTSIEQWRTYPVEETNEEDRTGMIQRAGWGNYRLYGNRQGGLEDDGDFQVVSKAVEQLHKLQSSSEPWCMYIGTFGPHDPYVIPESYAQMYDPHEIDLPPNYADTLQNKPNAYKRMRQVWDQLSEAEVKQSIAHYWGYCTMMDDLFGRVLEALEQTGQTENTLVLFLSDHGESLGSHGLYLKGISPYDETYKVPCVMRWPKQLSQARGETDALISIMDFAPTFLELAGLPVPEDWNGRSLMPWIDSGCHQDNKSIDHTHKGWRDAVFTQCNGVEIYFTQRIVRTKRHKLVYNPTDLDELYDLQEDPFEMHNLSDNPKYKEVKQALFNKLWREAAVSRDIIFNSYPTVAHAEWGPAAGIGIDR